MYRSLFFLWQDTICVNIHCTHTHTYSSYVLYTFKCCYPPYDIWMKPIKTTKIHTITTNADPHTHTHTETFTMTVQIPSVSTVTVFFLLLLRGSKYLYFHCLACEFRSLVLFEYLRLIGTHDISIFDFFLMFRFKTDGYIGYSIDFSVNTIKTYTTTTTTTTSKTSSSKYEY